MVRIGRQRVRCDWPSVSCWPLPAHPETIPDPASTSSTESSEDIRSLRACPHLLAPCLMWPLSLLLLVGLSACGPASSDPSPSLESRASLSEPSESHPVSQNSPSSHNDPVKPAASLVPFASNQVSVPDQRKAPAPMPGQKEAPVPRPDRPVLPDRTEPSLLSSENHGFLSTMNVWTQAGTPASVVALEDPNDDASIEEDAKIERQNWDVAHEAERLEDEKEQEETPGERKER